MKTDECHLCYDELNDFIWRLQNGGVGAKVSGTWESNVIDSKLLPAMDLADTTTSNLFNVHYITKGRKEAFLSRKKEGSLQISARPRYFQIGPVTQKDTVEKMADINEQMELVQHITGQHPSIVNAAIGERRRQNWTEWATDGNRSYQKIDLPMLMEEFSEVLCIDDLPDGLEYSSAAVTRARNDIVDMLYRSNVIVPRRSNRNAPVNTMLSTSDDGASEQQEVEAEAAAAEREEHPSTPKRQKRAKEPTLSSKFDFSIHSMREVIEVDGIDGVKQLGEVEIAVGGLRRKVLREVIAESIISRGGTARYDVIDCLEKLTPRELSNAALNFKRIRKDIASNVRFGLFQPSEDQLLLDYINDGLRYSNGSRLPSKLFIPTQNSSRFMTDVAGHCIRHIIFNYCVPLSRFPGLLNCFAVLLLGTALSQDNIPAIPTIRNRIYRLQEIDKERFKTSHESKFTCPDEYGFVKYWYTTSDDTEHNRKFDKRHVLLMTSEGEDGEPFFEFLTGSGAYRKDSEGNTDLNVDAITSTLSIGASAHYGGNTSDNAADALLEGKKTFYSIMKKVEDNEDEAISSKTYVYGVERRPIVFGDPFHVDNLLMTHASIGMGGPTERGNHSMMHHRQLLMNLHSIHTDDPTLSQAAADAVLNGTGHKYKIQTSRERQQRWLVNQRHAKRVIKGLELLGTDADESFWLKWARYMHERTSGWKRRSLGETITMLLMPSIIVSIYFESELGDYFEVTYEWHANPGALCNRPGFRMMEYHQLYFEYIAPWWKRAKEEPQKNFPKTFAYLGGIDDVDLHTLKTRQISNGTAAACDVLSKHSSILLSAPVLYLVLSHPDRGRDFLRAALAVASESGVNIGVGWGRYQYDNPDDRPAGEKMFYEKLCHEKEESAHWFRQLGFCQPVVQLELQELSMEEKGIRTQASSTWLGDFRAKYPIIFAALSAVFRQLPSNSRLTESTHGDMRQNKDDSHVWRFTDARQMFMTNQGHKDREERRKFMRSMAASNTNNTTAKHEECKDTVEMVGRQLLKATEQYTFEALYADFDEDTRKKLSVGSVVKEDFSEMEKKIAAKKVEETEKARRRKTSRPVTLEEWKKAADDTLPDNDKDWDGDVNSDAAKRLERLHTMIGVSYWDKSVTPLNPTFYNEVKAVLPYLWTDGMMGQQKKFLMSMVRDHLSLIKGIADKQRPNTISEKDLTGMSADEICSEFVKVDDSIHYQQADTAHREKLRLNSVIIESCGSKVASRKRYGGDGYNIDKELAYDVGDTED